MMIGASILAGAAALALQASPAPATDWPYPAWGTTSDAVLSGGSSAAARETPTDGNAVFGQRFEVSDQGSYAELPVRILYFFDRNDRLSLIKLTPSGDAEDRCDALQAVIQSQFGNPDTIESKTLAVSFSFHRMVWSDRADDRAVMFAVFDAGRGMAGRLCHVTFQPYGKNGKPGFR